MGIKQGHKLPILGMVDTTYGEIGDGLSLFDIFYYDKLLQVGTISSLDPGEIFAPWYGHGIETAHSAGPKHQTTAEVCRGSFGYGRM